MQHSNIPFFGEARIFGLFDFIPSEVNLMEELDAFSLNVLNNVSQLTYTLDVELRQTINENNKEKMSQITKNIITLCELIDNVVDHQIKGSVTFAKAGSIYCAVYNYVNTEVWKLYNTHKH